ncbi:PREDICTED: translation initiation factor eIF-2B subunit epsilon isoform X1 [Dinoponera quadriceps]|uniref:Translation initiation factor eIF2B subunit epsilon n=1 Tax=Dinoponera quadriceps TaxID=609295 RepID=A0A6P3XMB5_DINQU|nr:PREDICTED: translation initiation factor eIF-2B subunit epsilon isoform X1 [Dinoponera quadriceps]
MDSKVCKKDPLQAVVLTDDFTTSMTPLQKLYPSILMPVISRPLLDYMMETLERSKVEEIFLYCSSHVDSLKEYVEHAKKKFHRIAISLIVSDDCRCLGDALRDIYGKGCLRGNFILLRGNAFTNTNLRNLFDLHRSKTEKDKGAVMTMVLRNVGPTKNTLLDEETTLVVSNKTDDRILHYEKLKNHEKKVKMKISWFLNHDEVQVSTSFLDTHVYMCSPSVLSLFADNFDFQTMDDFIRGVVSDDVLDSSIYYEELNPEDYALAIPSWKIYHLLTKNVMGRYSYPLTPDCLLSATDIVYSPLNSSYKHKSAILSKGCLLEQKCFIGQNSTLGDHTTVNTSVIMNNCVIGSNVLLCDSYVFPNVKIEDNCTVTNSILFPNCVVRNDSKIDECILCPEIEVEANSKYADAFVESPGELSTTLSGLNGKEGFYYFKSNVGVESDDSSTESSSTECCNPVDDTNMFLSEVIDSLLRGYQDKLKCEHLILEINSSRYAYNVSVREVTYNVVKGILLLPLHYLAEINEPVSNKSYQKHLKAVISYFKPIIRNYVKNTDAQDDCLHAIEDVASTTDETLPCTLFLLHDFYDCDILSEEKILEWYESEVEDLDVRRKKVRDAVKSFAIWLREAEEDSSDNGDS